MCGLQFRNVPLQAGMNRGRRQKRSDRNSLTAPGRLSFGNFRLTSEMNHGRRQKLTDRKTLTAPGRCCRSLNEENGHTSKVQS